MREDEEKCKKAFDSFLKQLYQENEYLWIPQEDRNKSPDIFLQLLGTKYAVEITSILEKTKIGSSLVEHVEIDESVMDFVENIKKEAISDGTLRGTYTVFYKENSELFTLY